MPRVLILLAVLALTACQGVSAEHMASAPPETYYVEYYYISER